MQSKIFIGPPAIGKSRFNAKYKSLIMEPEAELDWKTVNRDYAVYLAKYAGKSIGGSVTSFEQNIHWPALWVDKIIPMVIKAIQQNKHIILSLITPTSIEMARTFLSSFKENTVMVKVVSGVETKSINTLAVAIFDYTELPFYQVTSYPGDLLPSPEFPSDNQSAEKYAISKQYWDKHVFVI
jgi:hypothetical protein